MQRDIPYLSLTEVVEDYMISTYNDRRKYLANYLVHARWIWKKLMWSTEWQYKSVTLPVLQDESGQCYLLVPKDMVRFGTLSRVDGRGRLRPFLTDDRISVTTPSVTNGEKCSGCGKADGLTAAIKEFTPITKQVLINGTAYVEKTWRRLDAGGQLTEIREVPALDFTNPQAPVVTKTTMIRTLCTFIVNSCGCIKDCTSNRQLIEAYCGSVCSSVRVANCANDWAKITAKNGRIYFSPTGRVPDFVVMSYQTNGECGDDEIMIPEYALDAVTTGIHWRAGRMAPATVVPPQDKRDREILWDKSVQELQEFLNPISAVDFMATQMLIPMWGADNVEPEVLTCFKVNKNAESSNPDCKLTEADINLLIDSKLAQITVGGLQGPKGDKGDPGGVAEEIELSYHHDQATPATVWTINHNLGFNPTAEVKDKNGVMLIGWDYAYPTINQMVITHGFAIAGDAQLS